MGILSELKKLLSTNKKGKTIRFEILKRTYDNGNLYVHITVENFDEVLDEVLTDPMIQILWNDIKDRLGKNVNEQELYNVFKFFIFTRLFYDALTNATEVMKIPDLLSNKSGYNLYTNKELFDGKLNEKTFKKLVGEMYGIIRSEKFYKRYTEYLWQKKTKCPHRS